MAQIEMTLENELKRKKESLKFFYQMAQEALDAKDLEQAIEISAKGLKEAEEKNQREWAEKFDALNSQVESAKEDSSLNPSIVREDITVIKGVGIKVAEKLKNAGFHTVQSLADATIPQLTYLPGIGQKTAQKIIEGATTHLSRKSLNDFPEETNKTKELLVKSEVNSETVIDELEKPPSPQPKSSQITKEKSKKKYTLEEIDDEFDYEIKNEQKENEPVIIDENAIQKGDIETSVLSNTITQNTVPLIDAHQRAEIKSSLQETYNYGSQQNKTIQVQEILQTSEKKSVIESVVRTLQGLNFHIIEKVRLLKDLSMNSDLIALKVIHANEFLDLVLILPIKLNTLRGEVKVSNEQVKYIPFNEKFKENGSTFRLQLDSTIKDLEEVFTIMRNDLVNEGKLLSYLRTHLQVDISIEKSITKKNLFFRAGKLQFKIFIEPMLLCSNDVGFLEKRIPFSYLKDINLHVLSIKELSDFLTYLEKKYFLIEEHSDQKSSLLSYEDSFNQFLRTGKKLSIPFIGFGVILLMLVLFQSFTFLELMVNIGYALLGVYTTSLVYLYIKFFKIKLEIQTDFGIPFHQKQVQIDDTRLILISDELSPEMMNQFVYECLGKNSNSPFIRRMEESFTKELLNKKVSSSKIESEPLFEDREVEEVSQELGEEFNEETQEEEEYINKYSSFLED